MERADAPTAAGKCLASLPPGTAVEAVPIPGWQEVRVLRAMAVVICSLPCCVSSGGRGKKGRQKEQVGAGMRGRLGERTMGFVKSRSGQSG